MCQQDFEADTNILANVTIGNLQEAQINENNYHPIQNKCVQRLQHHPYATSSTQWLLEKCVQDIGLRFGESVCG